MADNKLQTTYIRLVDEDGSRTVRAPADFCCYPYPDVIEMDGKQWEQFFVQDAVPHYRLVGMVVKSSSFLLDLPSDNNLEVGTMLEFKPGPWKVVTVYPFYPTGHQHQYRQSVDIEGPGGERITVDDAFIARWFRRGR
jgi:hypothetical protein